MSTITKEQLRERAREKVKSLEFSIMQTAFADSRAELEEELELARIALASLEAEPAGYMNRFTGRVFTLEEQPGADTDSQVYMPVYTAPPVPVSVPDLKGLDEFIFNLVSAMASEELSHNEKELFSIASKYISYARERFSPAMLQGAEPVTTAYKLPDDFDLDRFNDVVWLEAVASNPHMHSPTTSTIAMVALELNKRLETGNSQVVPDGYCIMPLKLTADNGAKGALCGEFHVQYRIVCQSCVGEGCEDCNHTGGWDAEIPVSWDTIKRIHEAAVEACTLPAAPQQEAKNV